MRCSWSDPVLSGYVSFLAGTVMTKMEGRSRGLLFLMCSLNLALWKLILSSLGRKHCWWCLAYVESEQACKDQQADWAAVPSASNRRLWRLMHFARCGHLDIVRQSNHGEWTLVVVWIRSVQATDIGAASLNRNFETGRGGIQTSKIRHK